MPCSSLRGHPRYPAAGTTDGTWIGENQHYATWELVAHLVPTQTLPRWGAWWLVGVEVYYLMRILSGQRLYVAHGEGRGPFYDCGRDLEFDMEVQAPCKCKHPIFSFGKCEGNYCLDFLAKMGARSDISLCWLLMGVSFKRE